MNTRINSFSFHDSTFDDVVAHDGIGTIQTVRVADKGKYRGLNFIDLTIIPPGSTIGLHTHGAHDEEVYVVISGCGQMSMGREEFPVKSGDVIVNPAGGTHGLRNIGDEPVRIVVLDVPAPE
ncbi:MAG: cupin domain-containing protein [Woeseiaceae bacterium]